MYCCPIFRSGRWAVVYQATHRFSGIQVALKRVLKRDDGVVQRFMLREKEVIKRVKGHKHVVDLYEVFEDAEFIYLVQEYLPAGTLRERLRRV
jgi:serine/threonine protein kinase